jgi:hypothetical protein
VNTIDVSVYRDLTSLDPLLIVDIRFDTNRFVSIENGDGDGKGI